MHNFWSYEIFSGNSIILFHFILPCMVKQGFRNDECLKDFIVNGYFYPYPVIMLIFFYTGCHFLNFDTLTHR